VASGKLQELFLISVVGKAVLTLYPPLRPLSHNVNPRDGAQDICYIGVNGPLGRRERKRAGRYQRKPALAAFVALAGFHEGFSRL
jgi:hypothetical protein